MARTPKIISQFARKGRLEGGPTYELVTWVLLPDSTKKCYIDGITIAEVDAACQSSCTTQQHERWLNIGDELPLYTSLPYAKEGHRISDHA